MEDLKNERPSNLKAMTSLKWERSVHFRVDDKSQSKIEVRKS